MNLTEMALKSLAVSAIAYLAFLGSRRLSAATRHMVLAIGLAVLGLVTVLAFIPQRVSLAVLPPTPSSAASPSILEGRPVQVLAPDVKVRTAEPTSGPLTAGSFAPLGLAEPKAVPETAVRPFSIPWTLVFALGAGVSVLPLIVGFALAIRLRHRSELRSGYRVGDVSMPMVLPLIPPVILLPRESDSYSESDLRVVLTHERAHIERGDLWINGIAWAVGALHWFNPLAWVLLHHLRQESEKAADDVALAEAISPADYAQVLTTFVRRTSAPVGALPLARLTGMKERVSRILTTGIDRVSPSRQRSAAILVVSLAVGGTAAALQLSSPRPEAILAGEAGGMRVDVAAVMTTNEKMEPWEPSVFPAGTDERRVRGAGWVRVQLKVAPNVSIARLGPAAHRWISAGGTDVIGFAGNVPALPLEVGLASGPYRTVVSELARKSSQLQFKWPNYRLALPTEATTRPHHQTAVITGLTSLAIPKTYRNDDWKLVFYRANGRPVYCNYRVGLEGKVEIYPYERYPEISKIQLLVRPMRTVRLMVPNRNYFNSGVRARAVVRGSAKVCKVRDFLQRLTWKDDGTNAESFPITLRKYLYGFDRGMVLELSGPIPVFPLNEDGNAQVAGFRGNLIRIAYSKGFKGSATTGFVAASPTERTDPQYLFLNAQGNRDQQVVVGPVSLQPKIGASPEPVVSGVKISGVSSAETVQVAGGHTSWAGSIARRTVRLVGAPGTVIKFAPGGQEYVWGAPMGDGPEWAISVSYPIEAKKTKVRLLVGEGPYEKVLTLRRGEFKSQIKSKPQSFTFPFIGADPDFEYRAEVLGPLGEQFFEAELQLRLQPDKATVVSTVGYALSPESIRIVRRPRKLVELEVALGGP